MNVPIIVAAAGVAALLALVWLNQRRLIYYPLEHRVPAVAAVLPGAVEVLLTTDDGLTLGAWWLAASGAGPHPAAIVFNGNAGHRAGRVDLATGLSRLGLSVLLFDYRGYGGNPGDPTESGLAADARAARHFLDSRPEVDPGRVVYIGESLGGAVAVALAADRPPAALVLRSPFTSLVDAARVHYPWLPVRWLLSDRYPSIERIGRIGCPVLIVAGDADRIVPESQSRRLFEAAAGPKRYVTVAGADHNHSGLAAGRPFLDPVERFLREHGILESK